MKVYEKMIKYLEQVDFLIKNKAISTSPAFVRWKLDVERLIANEYGQTSYEFKKFTEISFDLNSDFFLQDLPGNFSDFSDMVNTQQAEDCKTGLLEAKELLETLLSDYNYIAVSEGKTMKFDVFISHANKDKSTYIDELKSSIDRLGVNVFYDKDTLEWGDNWKQKLLEGINSAEFAIVVISENFFGREWTEKELNNFLNRQNSTGQKIILPILHNITINDLQTKYAHIADLQALDSSKFTCDQIALLFAKQLIKRIRSNDSTMKSAGPGIDKSAKLTEYYEELIQFVHSHEKRELEEVEKSGKVSMELYSDFYRDLNAVYQKAMPLFDEQNRKALKNALENLIDALKAYSHGVLDKSPDLISLAAEFTTSVYMFESALTKAFQIQLMN